MAPTEVLDSGGAPIWICARRGRRLETGRSGVYKGPPAHHADGVFVAATAAIAAGDPQTAAAGAALLRAGGNAVDAACAAAFASCVVESPLASPAGSGVALYGDAAGGFEALDFFSAVPGLGGRPAELDFHAVTIDFGATTQDFHVGRAAASVPTAAVGLLELHSRRGRAPLEDVLAPAIALARDGFSFNAQVTWILRLLTPIVHLTPQVEALHCREGEIVQAGRRLTNPQIATFFECLARDGMALLRGPFAEAVLADFGPQAGGQLSAEDLGGFAPRRLSPLRVPFAGHEVLLQPPPSSGGALIGLALRLLEHHGGEAADFLGAAHQLAVADALAVTSSARAGGFDALVRAAGPTADLLSDDAISRWRARRVAEERALGSTTHISVMDASGGAAAITLTNGEGCGHVVGDFGFQMNNFLGEEDINPGGFHRQPAGSLMSTMMAPTIALRDGRPTMVLGSGGSNRIRSVVLQALVNALAWRRPLREAITAPRLHVEGQRLWFEDVDLPAGAAAALRADWPGATAFAERNMYFGGVHAVALGPGGTEAVADHRRGGGVALL